MKNGVLDDIFRKFIKSRLRPGTPSDPVQRGIGGVQRSTTVLT